MKNVILFSCIEKFPCRLSQQIINFVITKEIVKTVAKFSFIFISWIFFAEFRKANHLHKSFLFSFKIVVEPWQSKECSYLGFYP